jgi:exodeoxyribonuclease VII large subunit
MIIKQGLSGFRADSNEDVLSVSQFLDQLNLTLEPNRVTVQGELGRIDVREKAVYFSIKDKDDGSLLSCFAWKWDMDKFGSNFEEGMEVKILGFPKIYKPNGRLSFQVENMTPVGEGALKKAYDLLVKRLQDLGYFAEERKQTLPSYVKKIGLITSEQADAKKDFLTHLGQHNFQIYFYDVRVEGLRAVEEIIKAIKWLNENGENIEVLVLTRGGGSYESLQAFNSEAVAKAIYASKIPVVSAIGHENDETISDLVADFRASTPTDAGKVLAQPWLRARQAINHYQSNILSALAREIRQKDETLKQFGQRVVSSFDRILIARKKQVETLNLGLVNTAGAWLKFLNNKLKTADEKLELVDPAQKLKQGYSLVFNQNGKVVKSVESLLEGDELDITFFKGKTKSKIINILK